MEERISLDQVEAAIEGIREKYNSDFYPFEVRESGGGWQFLTRKDYYKTIAQLNGDKFLKRLSNAALETLAIIAYKQPITKGEVEAIRGVNSDYSIQKLLEKDLIIIAGRNEELPGKPLIYATSKSFMDYFGINSADDLPKIKEVLAEHSIQGTLINDAVNIHVESEEELSEDKNVTLMKEASLQEPATTLIVADNGELIEQLFDEKDEEASDNEVLPNNNSDEINASDNANTSAEHSESDNPPKQVNDINEEE